METRRLRVTVVEHKEIQKREREREREGGKEGDGVGMGVGRREIPITTHVLRKLMVCLAQESTTFSFPAEGI